jgi:imidazolonepropionase-like amidohydrolase
VEAGKLADVLIVDGDVVRDIGLLQDRTRILAVIQGGAIKAGRLARTADG